MTSMIHKSIDQRRSRRNRYIEAIDPIRKRYNCSAKEVSAVVQGIERKNAELKEELLSLKRKILEVSEILQETQDTIEEGTWTHEKIAKVLTLLS